MGDTAATGAQSFGYYGDYTHDGGTLLLGSDKTLVPDASDGIYCSLFVFFNWFTYRYSFFRLYFGP
jgi:hypothetical protein